MDAVRSRMNDTDLCKLKDRPDNENDKVQFDEGLGYS